ncbi:MAG: TOBE domain-containing protein, partial [Sneathiella sp.]
NFIGSMNFFDGEVQSVEDGRYLIKTKALGLIRAKVNGMEFSIGEKMTVAIRPENIKIIKPDGEGNIVGSVEGEVSNAAYFGNSANIYVRLKETDQPILVALQNTDGAASAATHGDTKILLGWSSSAILLLKNGE